MAKLLHALAWAKRGYRVFPLAPDSRRPAWADWDWTREATTDEATIHAWWGAGDWNIGCCTGGGTVVVDLDVKREGQNGIASYLDLVGVFDTLSVRTTTGGLHLYFAGDGRNSQHKVGPGIDTRGDGGYVVAPGSTIGGAAYTIALDAPLAPLPAPVAEAMGRRPTVAASTPLTELDTPAILAAAQHWLTEQKPAVQGSRNGTTYWLACELRDRGVSEGVALGMVHEWNARSLPPLDDGEVETTVGSAYRTAQNPAGAKATEVLLGLRSLPIVLPPDEPAPATNTSHWSLGSVTPLAELTPRPWLYRRFLMRGEITTLAAAGAAGKSQLTITAAVHLALGRDFYGFKLAQPGQPGNSLLYNAEDRLDEMSRRLYAACSALGVEPHRVIPHIALVSGRSLAENRPVLVRMGGAGPEVVVEDVNLLLNMCYHQQIALLGLDPLVKIHRGLSESDNSQMDVVMEAISEISSRANLAVLLSHHIAKPGAAGTDAYVGSVDGIRGATNIVNSSRFAFTLAAPTQDDISRMNLTREQRERLVRLDDAKMNMALRSGEPVWIEKRTVLLPTGDEVGAFMPADMVRLTASGVGRMAAILLEQMNTRGVASLSLAEAVAIVQDADPIYAKMTARAAKLRLEGFFVEDVPLKDGGALHLTPGERRMVTLKDA